MIVWHVEHLTLAWPSHMPFRHVWSNQSATHLHEGHVDQLSWHRNRPKITNYKAIHGKLRHIAHGHISSKRHKMTYGRWHVIAMDKYLSDTWHKMPRGHHIIICNILSANISHHMPCVPRGCNMVYDMDSTSLDVQIIFWQVACVSTWHQHV